MTKKYRIVKPVRFTIFLVLCILVLTIVVSTCLGFNDAQSLSRVEYMHVKVLPGDTLWSIAETYMPAQSDVRQNVYALCQVNDMTAEELYAGMTIRVPVYQTMS